MELAELTIKQFKEACEKQDVEEAAIAVKSVFGDDTEKDLTRFLSMLCDLALRSLQAARELPEEPTNAMYHAGLDYLNGRGTAWCVIDLYKAMYRAHAPKEC